MTPDQQRPGSIGKLVNDDVRPVDVGRNGEPEVYD
jgi:hypothetical protein